MSCLIFYIIENVCRTIVHICVLTICYDHCGRVELISNDFVCIPIQSGLIMDQLPAKGICCCRLLFRAIVCVWSITFICHSPQWLPFPCPTCCGSCLCKCTLGLWTAVRRHCMTKIRKHFKCPFSYAAHRKLSLCITYLNVYMLCVSTRTS